MTLRKPTPEEEQFIAFMIKRSKRKFPETWRTNLMVSSIDVAESGSLNLFPNGQFEKDRDFGDEACEYIFKDKDGVKVVAALNIDEKGNLFELDIWKDDFSNLLKFPEVS